MSLLDPAPNKGSSERQVEALRHSRQRPRATKPGKAELHVCQECGSDLVHPTDWAPVGERHWQVSLRCPECEWRGAGVHNQEVVDRLDIELDRGTDAVIDDLTSLTRANMEEEVERFISALHADHVLPEDF